MPEQSNIKKEILERGIKSLLDEAKVPMKIHLEIIKQLNQQIKNHENDIQKWNKIIEKREFSRGEPGYTPIKGVDYFDGKNGEPGTNGENYILTEKDKKEIAKFIKIPVVKQLVKEIVKEQPIITEVTKIIESKEKLDEEKLFESFVERMKKEQVFDSSNIKGLQGFIKNGVSYKFEELMRGGGSSVVTYSADLSSQCDGNNKIFTVPTNSAFILLVGTDAPLVYKQTTDYTGSGTTTLTLTSGVNAPSLGATFILTYKA